MLHTTCYTLHTTCYTLHTTLRAGARHEAGPARPHRGRYARQERAAQGRLDDGLRKKTDLSCVHVHLGAYLHVHTHAHVHRPLRRT